MEPENYEIHGHVQLQPEAVHESGIGQVLQPAPCKEESAAEMVKDGSRLEATFRRAMCKEFQISDRYTSVGALIVRWADELDDLKCAAEVKELHDLFQNDFHFSSRVLKLNTEKKPQHQLNHAISELVHDFDGPCRRHLLIVYYSGHGVGKQNSHELELRGNAPTENAYAVDEADYEARAEWTRAELPLNEADADVLIILDCCAAANIIKKGGQASHRCHELYTAVGRNKLATIPGSESFTRHFIDALKEQLDAREGQSFTTFELHDAISRRRQDFSSSLTHRHGGTWPGRNISLAPLDQKRADATPPPPVAFHRTGNTASLDLRLVFRTDTMLEEEEANDLATKLSKAAKEADGHGRMGLQSIEWVGYQPSISAVMIRHGRHYYLANVYGKKWAKMYRARRKRKAESDSSQVTLKKRALGGAEDMPTPGSLASRNASPS